MQLHVAYKQHRTFVLKNFKCSLLEINNVKSLKILQKVKHVIFWWIVWNHWQLTYSIGHEKTSSICTKTYFTKKAVGILEFCSCKFSLVQCDTNFLS